MINGARVASAATLVFLLTLHFSNTFIGSVWARSEREVVTLITQSGRHVISAEIADTPFKQSRGLMFRRSMPSDQGMLFLYDSSQKINMWMKNTFIPLDMVFIRSNGIVHRIETDTEPFSERIISSGGEVIAVLELNAGTSARLQLKAGDRIEHKYFKQ